MENIESLQAQLSLAGEIAVRHKNNILTDRIFLQISGRKQISAQQVINGTTVQDKDQQAQGSESSADVQGACRDFFLGNQDPCNSVILDISKIFLPQKVSISSSKF